MKHHKSEHIISHGHLSQLQYWYRPNKQSSHPGLLCLDGYCIQQLAAAHNKSESPQRKPHHSMSAIAIATQRGWASMGQGSHPQAQTDQVDCKACACAQTTNSTHHASEGPILGHSSTIEQYHCDQRSQGKVSDMHGFVVGGLMTAQRLRYNRK